MEDQQANGSNSEDAIIETLRAEIDKTEPSRRSRILEKFFLAALSSIPWVGGVLSAAEGFRTDEGNLSLNRLQTQWLEEHQRKIGALAKTLQKIGNRLADLGSEIEERIQSEDYLALVRKAFRIWDESDTEEKRRLLVLLCYKVDTPLKELRYLCAGMIVPCLHERQVGNFGRPAATADELP